MVTICHGAQEGWEREGFDAKTAYLQPGAVGKVFNRILMLRLPKAFPPPGKRPGQVVMANGAIYGTKDAGRHWYLYLRAVLLDHGMTESRLEKGPLQLVPQR